MVHIVNSIRFENVYKSILGEVSFLYKVGQLLRAHTGPSFGSTTANKMLVVSLRNVVKIYSRST